MSVLTILEASVSPGREEDLLRAYRAAAEEPLPPFIVRSFLVRATDDPGRWRIMTEFVSREELEKMRSSGEKPRGVQIFNEAGAQPTLSIFEILDRFSNE